MPCITRFFIDLLDTKRIPHSATLRQQWRTGAGPFKEQILVTTRNILDPDDRKRAVAPETARPRNYGRTGCEQHHRRCPGQACEMGDAGIRTDQHGSSGQQMPQTGQVELPGHAGFVVLQDRPHEPDRARAAPPTPLAPLPHRRLPPAPASAWRATACADSKRRDVLPRKVLPAMKESRPGVPAPAIRQR